MLFHQISLAFFNALNSQIDAYRILKNKSIAHWVNFLFYVSFVVFIILISPMRSWEGFLFCGSAFFNRQLFFDIPLNLRRGLAWDYQSTANPPKAIMDRIENAIFFGFSGAEIAITYFQWWAFFLSAYILTYL